MQEPPVQVMKTVTGQPLPKLGGFGEGGDIPKEALQQETFPSGGYQLPPLGGFGAGSTIPPGLLKPETFPLGKEKVQPLGGFGEGVQPEINNVFASRRNLQGHEDAGGHTIDRHVGKSDAWLKNRLATDPDIRAASTFRNKEAANRTDGQFIKQNKDAINEWLRAKKDNRFIGKITMKQPIGTVIKRDGTKYESYTAEVIIVRDSSSQGWHILTSYPEAE